MICLVLEVEVGRRFYIFIYSAPLRKWSLSKWRGTDPNNAITASSSISRTESEDMQKQETAASDVSF